VFEISGDGDIESDFVGIANGDNPVSIGDTSSASACGGASSEMDFTFKSFVIATHAAEHHFVTFVANTDVLVRGGEVGIAADAGGPIGGKVDDEDVIGQGANVFALIVDAVAGVGGESTGGIEGEFTTEMGVVVVLWEGEIEVAEGLIRHALISGALYVWRSEVLCGAIVALPHELLYFG